MITVLILWTTVTGYLFTTQCDSPFLRGKDECKAHNVEMDKYFNRVWLNKRDNEQ